MASRVLQRNLHEVLLGDEQGREQQPRPVRTPFTHIQRLTAHNVGKSSRQGCLSSRPTCAHSPWHAIQCWGAAVTGLAPDAEPR